MTTVIALVDLETGENVTDDPTPDITISQMGDNRPGFSHRLWWWWCGCAIILRDLKQETTDLQISQRERPQVLHRPAPVRAGAARRIVINISCDSWHHVTLSPSSWRGRVTAWQGWSGDSAWPPSCWCWPALCSSSGVSSEILRVIQSGVKSLYRWNCESFSRPPINTVTQCVMCEICSTNIGPEKGVLDQ